MATQEAHGLVFPKRKCSFDKYNTVKKKPNGADNSKNKEIFKKKRLLLRTHKDGVSHLSEDVLGLPCTRHGLWANSSLPETFLFLCAAQKKAKNSLGVCRKGDGDTKGRSITWKSY